MVTRFTCPIDGERLVPVERQGIEIDHCPECRGVWLDRGELDKIIERSTAAAAPASQPVHAYDPRHGAPPYQGGHQGHPGQKRRKSFLEELFD